MRKIIFATPGHCEMNSGSRCSLSTVGESQAKQLRDSLGDMEITAALSGTSLASFQTIRKIVEPGARTLSLGTIGLLPPHRVESEYDLAHRIWYFLTSFARVDRGILICLERRSMVPLLQLYFRDVSHVTEKSVKMCIHASAIVVGYEELRPTVSWQILGAD